MEGARTGAEQSFELRRLGREVFGRLVEDAARAAALERLDLRAVVIGRREDLVAVTDPERPEPGEQAVAPAREQPAAFLLEREREAAAVPREPHPRVQRRQRHQQRLSHRTRASARRASGLPKRR